MAVLAQAVTVAMTWPLWQVREQGLPNLPLTEVPQIPFGIVMLGSTLLVVAFPRPAIWVHLGVLAIASGFDQMRLQPQFLANAILMSAVIFPTGRKFARWFLVSLWLWAGLHKALSPDWWTHVSWVLSHDTGLDPAVWYLWFAGIVAGSEIALGLLAWFKPRWAAVGCPALHVGIVVFLSPLFKDWNYSVFPWNLATALIGSWVLLHSVDVRPKSWERITLAVLLVVPASFYIGLLDHGYSHVLYSENIPNGMITRADGQTRSITGWGTLNVPFPNERRLLHQHFARTSSPGDKLHIRDPRRWLSDQFWTMTPDGPKKITTEDFFRKSETSPAGVGKESSVALFRLRQSKCRLLRRSANTPIYAIEILPDQYSPWLLELAAELPNLEQIQLQGTAVTDQDLKPLLKLPRLEAVGIKNTAITVDGKALLESIPSMQLIDSNFQ